VRDEARVILVGAVLAVLRQVAELR